MRKELSEKTKKYFQELRNELNYRGANNGWDGIEEILKKNNKLEGSEIKKLATYRGYFNTSEIDIYQYKINGEYRFCAEYGYGVGGDDYNIETHIFTKLPSEDEVKMVVRIAELEYDISDKRIKEEVYDYEQEKMIHWTDKEGGFDTKEKFLLSPYL